MKRTIATPPWAIRARRLAKPSTLDPALRKQLVARAQGLCELCLERLPTGGWHGHHRLLKGQGGLDILENLLALDALCHKRVHGHVKWALDHGFLVPAHGNPATAPVCVGLTRWVLLDPDGGMTDTDPPTPTEEPA